MSQTSHRVTFFFTMVPVFSSSAVRFRPSGRQSLQLCKEGDKRLPIRCISDPPDIFPVFGISLKASVGGGGRAGAAGFFGGGGGGGGGMCVCGGEWDSALRRGAVTSVGISQPYHSHPALHLFTSAAKGLAIQVRD